MKKEELRRLYKEKRDAITSLQKQKWEDMMLIHFQHIELPFVRCVHTYIASEKHAEFETDKVIRYLEFLNPQLIVSAPRIHADGSMTNYIIDEETGFTVNKFGIAEPESGELMEAADIDLVLVPLLTFDNAGHRVGFGKGYYDRFLTQCRSDVIKIGFSFFDADVIDDVNDFDIPLNYCVTPEKLYSF